MSLTDHHNLARLPSGLIHPLTCCFTHEEHVDEWSDRGLPDPSELAGIFGRDLPHGTVVTFSFEAGNRLKVDIENEFEGFSDSREYCLDTHTIHQGDMSVSQKGNGTGKKLLRNIIEGGRGLGCIALMVNASSDNGGYTWARAGIPLLDSDYIKKEARSEIGFRLAVISPFIPEDVYSQAAQLNAEDSIYNIHDLASLDCDLSIFFAGDYLQPNSGYVWGSFLSMYQQKYKTRFACAANPREMAEETLEKDMEKYRATAEHFLDRKMPYTLGRFLFTGVSYSGYLFFDDKKAMDRVRQYVGGFPSEAPNATRTVTPTFLGISVY
ncbi:MAG: hypothetical protein AAF549_03620 [Pseudomonadota bacterium]